MCLALDGPRFGCVNRPLAVNGLAQRVHHAADERFAHRHADDAARAPDRIAFPDALVGAQQHDGYTVLLQVQGHAVFAVLKLHQLVRHALFQPVGAGDAVAHKNDGARFGAFDPAVVIFDLAFNDLADILRF